MTKKLFRFFSEIEHAENFMAGNIYFRNLAHFQAIENDLARGDANEGTLQHRTTATGLTINNLSQGQEIFMPGFSFNSFVDSSNIFVFCLSETVTARILQEFKVKAIVEINRKREFIEKVKESLGDSIFHANRINYKDSTESVGIDWHLPSRIAFRKSRLFQWQHEYRIAYSKSDALADGKTSQSLSHESVRKQVEPTVSRTEVIACGSLEACCKISPMHS